MTCYFSKLFILLPVLTCSVFCMASDNGLFNSAVDEIRRHKLELFKVSISRGITSNEGLQLAKLYDPQEGKAIVDVALSLGRWDFVRGLLRAAQAVRTQEESLYPKCAAVFCPHRLSIHRRLLEIAGSEQLPFTPANLQDEILKRKQLASMALKGTSRTEAFIHDDVLRLALEKIFPGNGTLSAEQHHDFSELCSTFHCQGPWFVAAKDYMQGRIDKKLLEKFCKD